MANLLFPLLTGAVLAPLAAALAVSRGTDENGRPAALAGAAASLLCSLEVAREVAATGGVRLAEPWALPLLGAARPWFSADGLNATLLCLFSALALATLAAAPRRDSTRRLLVTTLGVLSATLAVYAADHLLVLLAAWVAALLPAWRSSGDPNEKPLPMTRVVLSLSVLALAGAVGLIGWFGNLAGWAAPFSLADTHTEELPAEQLIFGLLIVAAFLRKGIFPLHSWVVEAFDRGPLLPFGLVVNGHFGAFLIARVVIPLLPEHARSSFPLLSDLALITAVYAAVVAIIEKRPRRLLAYLVVSQASFILAGLESRNPEGISGSLLHWLVVSVATTGLLTVFRAVEARLPEAAHGLGHLGLAGRTPRLAVFFAICGLAIVGLPGTLGFCAEDLLFHGTLETHPWLGIALPVATALNAVHVFRLFSMLFLGRRLTQVAAVPDALPRERWAVAACAIFLIVAGLWPQFVVNWREPAAAALARIAGGG